MADLETNLESINKYKAKHNLPFMTQDQLLIKLFDEVAYVWRTRRVPRHLRPLPTYFLSSTCGTCRENPDSCPADAQETAMKVGDVVKEGDVLCYVEAMKTYNAIRAEFGGTITAICANPGDTVSEDDEVR